MSCSLHGWQVWLGQASNLGTVAVYEGDNVLLHCLEKSFAGRLAQAGKRPHRVGDVLRLELAQPLDHLHFNPGH